jgi:hypothetical protein
LSIIATYETAHETEGSRVYGRAIVFPTNFCDRKERLRLFHALGVVANTGVVAELHVFSDYAYYRNISFRAEGFSTIFHSRRTDRQIAEQNRSVRTDRMSR